MNGFVERLPWNLSALAALIVLVAGLATAIDPWVALERAGIAFVSFWIIGLLGRLAFRSSTSQSEASGKSVNSASHDHDGSG